MEKTMIEKLAEHYGFKINDRFQIVTPDTNGAEFRFTDKGVEQVENTGLMDYGSNWVLSGLVTGELYIIPVVTKPMYGTTYYTYDTTDWNIIGVKWEDTPSDFARLLASIVFTTQEMAEKYNDSSRIILRTKVMDR